MGLEPVKDTLKGVEKLTQIGCDVELSPFVPTASTPLSEFNPPPAQVLFEVYQKSKMLADKNGVIIGCRCIPCQYNILAFAKNMEI